MLDDTQCVFPSLASEVEWPTGCCWVVASGIVSRLLFSQNWAAAVATAAAASRQIAMVIKPAQHGERAEIALARR
jgi:hypothetical protein